MPTNDPPRRKQRVAVIGAGGIGGFCAAEAEAAGHDVTLCVRAPIMKLVVQSGVTTREPQVTVTTDPASQEGADWLLLSTKAQDTAAAAPWLRALGNASVKVVILQNGLDHEERVARFVDGATVLPAIVQIGAERIAPGHIVHHGGNRLVVPRGKAGAELSELFAGSGLEVRQTDDFLTATWRKLLGNVVANPVTALTLRRQEVLADPRIKELARGLLAETIAAGRAAGAKLSLEEIDRHLAHYGSRGDAGTSMLYDRLAGRPLEHDYITGAVIRTAERYGVDVPLNRALYALTGALSQGFKAPADAVSLPSPAILV